MKLHISRKEKGQSLVESALTIPLILLLIFTFLDLGRGIYYYSALGNSVREGARFASVTQIDYLVESEKDAVRDKVIHYSVALDLTYGDVSVSQTGADDELVTVSASYDFTPITPFLAQMLGSGPGITLNAETTMQLAPIARN